MRGPVDTQSSIFSYVDLESKVPSTHPLRRIRNIFDTAIRRMDSDLTAIYESSGRPSAAVHGPGTPCAGSLEQLLVGDPAELAVADESVQCSHRWLDDLDASQGNLFQCFALEVESMDVEVVQKFVVDLA